MFLSSLNAARRRAGLRFHIQFRRSTAAALVAGGALAALTGCSVTFPTPTPPATNAALINGGNDGLLIPQHVERADEDHARLGLPVQLDGKPVCMALDTGTQGTRVLKSVLPGSNYASAGGVTSFSFANGVEILGSAVKVPFSLGGTTPTPIAAQAVDVVRCLPNARKCAGMDGYSGEFGRAFSGIVGVGAARRGATGR
nr:hypothetical protein [Paraburkholderia sp. BL23I1N1]